MRPVLALAPRVSGPVGSAEKVEAWRRGRASCERLDSMSQTATAPAACVYYTPQSAACHGKLVGAHSARFPRCPHGVPGFEHWLGAFSVSPRGPEVEGRGGAGRVCGDKVTGRLALGRRPSRGCPDRQRHYTNGD